MLQDGTCDVHITVTPSTLYRPGRVSGEAFVAVLAGSMAVGWVAGVSGRRGGSPGQPAPHRVLPAWGASEPLTGFQGFS